MLLISIFEIPYGERLAKNVWKRYVQVIPRSTDSGSKIAVIRQWQQDSGGKKAIVNC